MTFDRTPCPKRTALPCVRSLTAPVCVTCRRELPATHPTTLDQADELFGDHRPLVARLPALQAQLAVRHALSMRTVADVLDEVVPMLELLARVRELVDMTSTVDYTEAGQHEPAATFIEAIRRTLYPGEVADGLPADGFLECAGCRQPFPAAEAHKLRTRGKLFAFEPGQFCPDCAAKYERGEPVP